MVGSSRRTEFVQMLLANDASERARFVGPLLDDLSGHDPLTRWRAALALGQVGRDDPRTATALVAALQDPAASVAEIAGRSLASLGEAAVPPLVEALSGTGAAAACGVLGAIGEPAVAALLRALSDVDPHVRWTAAAAIEEIGGAGTALALIGVLDDPAPEARECAISALSHVGSEALPSLIDALGARSALVRAGAAKALGGRGDPRAFMPLLAALGDPVPSVRGSAAWSIGTTSDPRALAPLLVALEDEDPAARAGAAAGLGHLADPRMTAPLVAALSDPDEAVRIRAAMALGEGGDRSAVHGLIAALTLDGSAAVRHEAANALGELGRDAVAPLLSALDDEDEEVRTWIVAALETIGAEQVTSALVELPAVQSLRAADIADALSWLAEDGSPEAANKGPGNEDDDRLDGDDADDPDYAEPPIRVIFRRAPSDTRALR